MGAITADDAEKKIMTFSQQKVKRDNGCSQNGQSFGLQIFICKNIVVWLFHNLLLFTDAPFVNVSVALLEMRGLMLI